MGSFNRLAYVAVCGTLDALKEERFRDISRYTMIKSHHQHTDNWVIRMKAGEEEFPRNDKGLIIPEKVTNTSKIDYYWHRRSESLRFRLSDVAVTRGRSIMLIRNPYEAIISLWKHYKDNGM